MKRRVITGWVEHLRPDGTTEVVESEFIVEDIEATIAFTRMQEYLASTAPTVITPFIRHEEHLFMSS
jgi:hypothetical protein